MASRKRDHKAEYRRRKEIAANAGFKSVRSYKRERKRLSLPRTVRIPTPYRERNQQWSRDHSRLPTSRWREGMSADMERAYFKAFPGQYDRIENGGEYSAQDLYDYLVEYDIITEEEWETGPYPKV